MKFWFKSPPISEPNPADVQNRDFAIQVEGCIVPEQSLGLVVHELTERAGCVVAGKKLGKSQNAQLWIIRDDTISIQFAPQARTPRAQIRIELTIVKDTYGQVSAPLIQWLKTQRQVISLTQLAEEIKSKHTQINKLVPGMSAVELNQWGKELSTALTNSMGLACTHVSRVTCYEQSLFLMAPTSQNQTDIPQNPTTPMQPDQEQEAKSAIIRPDTEPNTVSPSVVGIAETQTKRTWTQMLRTDEMIGKRLRAELPELAEEFRQLYAHKLNPAQQKQFGALILQLQAISTRVDVFPALQTKITQTVDPRIQAYLMVQTMQAKEALDQAWIYIEQAKQQPEQITAEHFQSMLERIEQSVQERLRPWWEIKL